jgi:hypothetical protein
MLENSSKRSLTKASDKLVALSAIAQMFSTFSKDANYLAGHFRHDLPQNLCWWSKDLFQKLTLIEPRKAPTWSWASVDGPLNMIFVDPFDRDLRSCNGWQRYEPVVINAEVDLVDPSTQFGQVTGGQSMLKGWSGILFHVSTKTYKTIIRFDTSEHPRELCIYMVVTSGRSLLLRRVHEADQELYERVGLMVTAESVKDFHQYFKGCTMRTVTIT